MSYPITEIEETLTQYANKDLAQQQKAYLKNQFEFYGIVTTKRRELYKPFLSKTALVPKDELPIVIKEFWIKPQRDFQYFGQELFWKYQKQYEESDIELIEYMITNKSWCDTVDFIASTIVGKYMLMFPNQRERIVDKWLSSNNIWLQRSCLLYQLEYKDGVDSDHLAYIIKQVKDTKEFFINKAIGWSLREYSKKNTDWVRRFIENTTLSNLSKKEGLKLIGID